MRKIGTSSSFSRRSLDEMKTRPASWNSVPMKRENEVLSVEEGVYAAFSMERRDALNSEFGSVR